jgi:hypothetical protein
VKQHLQATRPENVTAESRPQARRFLTVKQVTECHPGISERTLRHWIFGAQDRQSWERGESKIIAGNGFDRVMVRKGTKILIDEIALLAWLTS